MSVNHNDPGTPRRSKMPWIVGGVLVLLLIIFSLQNLGRGGAEAVGVTEAAPGDDNAAPSADTLRKSGES